MLAVCPMLVSEENNKKGWEETLINGSPNN